MSQTLESISIPTGSGDCHHQIGVRRPQPCRRADEGIKSLTGNKSADTHDELGIMFNSKFIAGAVALGVIEGNETLCIHARWNDGHVQFVADKIANLSGRIPTRGNDMLGVSQDMRQSLPRNW